MTLLRNSGTYFFSRSVILSCNVLLFQQRLLVDSELLSGCASSDNIVHEEVAKDELTLGDYGIYDKAILLAVLPMDGIAAVVLPGNRSALLPYSPTYTVSDLKKDIRVSCGLKESLQVLELNGSALSDTAILREFGTEISLRVKPTVDCVVISLLKAKKLTILVSLSESVSKLSALVAGKTSIVSSNQTLFWNGKQLEGDATLRESGIESGGVVQVLRQDEVRIWVKTALSGELPLYLHKSDIGLEAMKDAAKHFHVHFSQIRLHKVIAKLNRENVTIMPYSLRNIYCIVETEGEVAVFVEGCGVVKTAAGDRVRALRERVEVMGVRGARLAHRGRQLDDGKTVGEAGLTTFSKISLTQ